MSIYDGANEVDKVFVGSDEVDKVFVGSDMVYEKAVNEVTFPNIPDLKFFFDTSDLNTITHADGSVSQVDAVQGVGTLTQTAAWKQPTVGQQTVNGLDVLVFDGTEDLVMSSDMLDIGDSANTVILIYKNNNPSGNAMPWFIGDGAINFGAWRQVIQIEGAFSNVRFNQNDAVAVSGMNVSSYNDTEVHIIGMKFDGVDTLFKFFDGDTVTDTDSTGISTTGSVDRGFVGMNSDLCLMAVIGISRNITNAEANLIGNYANEKWGVSWTDL